MKIISNRLSINTKGNGDLVDITQMVARCIRDSHVQVGQVTLFNIGSTAAIITFEFEPGLIRDVQDLFEKLIPSNHHHHHDDTWGDANGFSHLRAALQGPSLVVPFEDNELLLGTWQQIVLAEFDNRPRQRQIVVQIIGK